MYHPTILRRLICLFLALGLAGALGSCSESTKPDTEYLGEYQVSVDYIEMPDTISTGDTLSLDIGGTTDPSGCLSFMHCDATRSSYSLELTVWADVYAWVGSGPPLPCGVVSGSHEALPPFYEGYFHVIINQPGGSLKIDSVFVIP